MQDGCRNGASCQFVHEKPGSKVQTLPANANFNAIPSIVKPTTSTPVFERVAKAAIAQPRAPVEKEISRPSFAVAHTVSDAAVGSNKRRKSHDNDDVGTTKHSQSNVRSSENTMYDEDEDEDNHSFLFNAVDVALKGDSPVASAVEKKKTKTPAKDTALKSPLESLRPALVVQSDGSGNRNPVNPVHDVRRSNQNGTTVPPIFRDHVETQRILSSSGTAHATDGPKAVRITNAKKTNSVTPVVASGIRSAISAPPVPKTAALPKTYGQHVVATPNIASALGRGNNQSPVAQINKSSARATAPPASTETNLLNEALNLISGMSGSVFSPEPVQRNIGDTIDPRALEWLPLVENTRLSQKFNKDYVFPTVDPSWVSSSKRYSYN